VDEDADATGTGAAVGGGGAGQVQRHHHRAVRQLAETSCGHAVTSPVLVGVNKEAIAGT
jgi:hypothetical protein